MSSGTGKQKGDIGVPNYTLKAKAGDKCLGYATPNIDYVSIVGIKRKGVVCASVSLLSLSVDAAGSLCGLDWQRYVGDSQLLPYSYPQGSLGSGRFFEAYNHVKQSLKDPTLRESQVV